MIKYHLYSRKFINSEGKEYKVWWYWYWEAGKRIRKPAGPSERLKWKALDFIEKLKLEDEEKKKNPQAQTASPLQPAAAFNGPRTFGEFARTLYLPGAAHLKRVALTDGAEISEATRKGHRSRLENYLIPKWGGDRPWSYFESEAFSDAFTDWLVDLERVQTIKAGAATTRKPTISNSTRNALVETMSISLREAKRARLLRHVPELERFARHSRHQDTLTDEEISKLFPEDKDELEKIWQLKDGRDLSTGILFGAMCCLGISAGLRSGELRAVTFEQIIRHRLPSGEMLYGLIVDRALNEKGEFVGLKKSSQDDPRERAVILSEKTMRILDMLYIDSVKQRTGLLFLHRGMPVRKETLERRWAAGLRQAGISLGGRRLTPHAMRYTYNTRMKMLLPSQTLREVIGHRSEDMTTLYDRPHLEERLLQLADQRSIFEKFWK